MADDKYERDAHFLSLILGKINIDTNPETQGECKQGKHVKHRNGSVLD